MRECCGPEIAAEQAVHVMQHVAVECGGHADGVVVRGIEARLVLLGVDADQQTAARPRRAMPFDASQENERRVRIEVADRRAGIEKGHRTAVEVGFEIEAMGEIGHDPEHFDLGIVGRHRGERFRDLVAGEIHGEVACGGEERQPRERLAAIAGAEVHELFAAADGIGDRIAMFAEDGPFGARRIVLRQLADGAEQRAAQRVVEVLGRNRRRARRKPCQERASFGGRVGHQAVDNAVVGHAKGGTALC
jgi:hypothetical protein